MTKKVLCMNPGPIEFEASVLKEFAAEGISHVDKTVIEVFGQCLEKMRKVFLAADGQPLLVSGSGTLGWDMVGANLVNHGDHALIINTGYFGDSFGECLERYGAKTTHLRADVGSQPTVEALVEALTSGTQFKLVTITHVDTSTGVLSHVKEFAAAVRKHQPNALVIVDGVCALGGEECRMKQWDLDVVLTGSQKCVGVPAGLSLMVIRPRALAAFEKNTSTVKYYVDWRNWLPIMKNYEARQPSYFATPAVNHLFALNKGLDILLDNGGMEQRFKEHRLVADAVKEAVKALGCSLVTAEGCGAHTLTCVRYPPGVGAADFLPKVVKRGVSLAGGLHKKIKTEYFRIGHMGPSTRRLDHVLKTIAAIEGAFIECGYDVPEKGAAVKIIKKLQSSIPVKPMCPYQMAFHGCPVPPRCQLMTVGSFETSASYYIAIEDMGDPQVLNHHANPDHRQKQRRGQSGHPRSGNTQRKHAIVAAPQTGAVIHRLNTQQVAALLKTFWIDVLQNNLKNVKKVLSENHMKMDFNAARYTPNADGTALHLCAQYGFVVMAEVLLDYGIGIDLQNRVGSTALHIACKFQQMAVVKLLLGKGAHVDIPDSQGRVAFDVASYNLLDACILQPLRDEVAKLRHVESELLSANKEVEMVWETAITAKELALMELADIESQSWEEGCILHNTREVEKEWDGKVKHWKHQLKLKLALFKEEELILQTQEDELSTTLRKELHQAEVEQKIANENLANTQQLLTETTRTLENKRQALHDQCGLVDMANTFPSDVNIQLWFLETILALIQDIGGDREIKITDQQESIVSMLLQREVLIAISNIFQRFPTHRSLLYLGLKSLESLFRLNHQMETNCEHNGKAIAFVTDVLKGNTMSIVSDAIGHFSGDIELVHTAFAVLYLLFHMPGSSKQVVRFSQIRQNQLLPLQLFRLHESVQESFSHSDINRSQQAFIIARNHAALVLFTLAKYNVKRHLVDGGVVPLALRLIFDTGSIDRDSEDRTIQKDYDVRTAIIRSLLGTLALLSSAPLSPAPNGRARSPEDSSYAGFSTLDTVEILRLLRPWFAPETGNLDAGDDSIAYWLIRLLRNLVAKQNIHGHMRIRTELRSDIACFDSIAMATKVVKIRTAECSNIGASSITRNVLDVCLELVERVWIEQYDCEGRLLSTPKFVLAFLLEQLCVEAQHIDKADNVTTLMELTALLKTLALVLSNGDNMLFLIHQKSSKDIDTSIHIYLRWLHQIHDSHNCEEAHVFEFIAHILRVYLYLCEYERNQHHKTPRQLHDRCKAVGICAVLHAFSPLLHNDWNGVQVSNQGESDLGKGTLTSTTIDAIPNKPITMQVKTLNALSRTLTKMVHCTC